MAMVRRNILQLNIFTVKYSSTVEYNVLIFSVVHHIIVPNDAKFLDSLAFMDPTITVTVSSGQSPFSYREATTSEDDFNLLILFFFKRQAQMETSDVQDLEWIRSRHEIHFE